MDATTARSFLDELTKLGEKSDDEKLYDRILAASPVKVITHPVEDPDARRTAIVGPHFMQGTSEIHVFADHNQDSLAHEIGHAILAQSAIGRAAQSAPVRIVAGLAPSAALFGGMLSETPEQALAIGALGAAANLPNLATEAAASIKGYNVMKEVGATPEELKKYRNELGKSWLTYTAAPVGSAVNALVGAALGSHIRGVARGQ